jgi:hypothetical protein
MSALKPNMSLRTLVLAVFSVAVAVGFAACPGEPPPPCPIATGSPLGVPGGGSPLFILPDFWAKYTLTSNNPSDACAKLIGEEVAFQKFSTPGNLTDFTVALRSYRMGYQQGSALDYGAADSAQDYIDDSDPMNPVPASDPVIRQDPSDTDSKKMSALGKLTAFPDMNNLCHASDFAAADQDWAEVDVQLVDGGTASVNPGIALLDGGTSSEPLAGTAVITDDGGTIMAIFPELHEKYEWTDVQVISTTAVTGSVFKGTLRYTQDTCVATYDVFGVWPLTPCHTDTDCRPVPVPDATVCPIACAADSDCDAKHPHCDTTNGVCNTNDTDGITCLPEDVSIGTRNFQGSGLNPSFEDLDAGYGFKCNTDPRNQFILSTYGIGSDWGACELNMPFDKIQQLH